MIDISHKYEHYRQRFVEALEARSYTSEGFADVIGVHSVTIAKLRNGTFKLDDEWRARTAAGLNLPEGVLYGDEPLPAPRSFEIFVSKKKRGRPRKAGNDNRMIPLYGLAAGSLDGVHSMTSDPVEEVPCPPALQEVLGAYALKTKGESMIPRYFPDDRLYVNPQQKVRMGDHVIIQVQRYDNSGTETWVKRFDGEDAVSVFVSQYNPPARMEFRKEFVHHVHRVLPINELF